MKLRVKAAASIAAISIVVALLSACGGGGGGDKQPPPPLPPPAPQPSAIISTLSVSPTTALVADGSASAHITVQLRDANGAPIEDTDAKVVLQADFGHLEYTKSGGEVTGTLDSTEAGQDTVSFSIAGTASPNTGVATFVAGPPSATASRIVLGAPGGGGAAAGVADGVTPLVATVTLRDRYGNPLLHGGDEVNVFSDRGAVGPVTDHGDGIYTADITSITAGSVAVSFALGESASSPAGRQARGFATAAASGDGGSFAPPPASASSDYMAPWTVEKDCSVDPCVDSGIYEVNTADPTAPAVQAVGGDLMTAGLGMISFSTIYRAYYDPTTDKVLQLGPATLIYAKDGRLHKLDLAHAGATPETLSTLTLSTLCYLYSFGPYGVSFLSATAGSPAWVVMQGFETPDGTHADCFTSSMKTWLIPVGGDAATVPMTGDINRFLATKALVAPATGQVEGLVLVDDAGNLDLYSANLASHTVLKPGFVPDGASVAVLDGTNLTDSLLMDVISTSGTTRSDALYRVTASGAAHVTTLSFSTANPCLDTSDCGGSPNVPHFHISSRVGPDGTVYFSYLTGSGWVMEALGPASSTPVHIYTEHSDYCIPINTNFDYSPTGKLLLTEYAAPSASSSLQACRVIAIDTAGPAGQTPAVLASDDAQGASMFVYYHPAVADNVWIEDFHCGDANCNYHNYVYTVYVASPNGTLLHAFPDSVVAGDAQQGFIASTGEYLRKYVAVAPSPSEACSSTGWVLYNAATLTPVASPDFGSGNCANGVQLYGPNDNFLLGSVTNSAGTQAWAFALFGVGGPAVAFGPYNPVPGTFARIIPMF